MPNGITKRNYTEFFFRLICYDIRPLRLLWEFSRGDKESGTSGQKRSTTRARSEQSWKYPCEPPETDGVETSDNARS